MKSEKFNFYDSNSCDNKVELIASELLGEIKKMPIVDAHSHLAKEEEALAQNADIFTRIFFQYSITNAKSAGFSKGREWLKDTSIPLEDRWEAFKPYLEHIRETGYARAACITARELYGIEEINDDTYKELSRKLQLENRPGLYNRILKEKCNIKRILNQGTWKDDGIDGYAVSLYRKFLGIYTAHGKRTLESNYIRLKELSGGDFKSLDDFVQCWFNEIIEQDYIGVKFASDFSGTIPEKSDAESAFQKLRQGRMNESESQLLALWIVHRVIDEAGKNGLVVAIHCGLSWDCGENFYDARPQNIIKTVLEYPNTKFDIYHGGIPWVREVAVLANQCPNVYLNLAWCHQISPFMTVNMLNEWMDIVPVNKIIGFGGDLIFPEKTYGTLMLAMENIAQVLAIRMQKTELKYSKAVDICRMWFYENPLAIYNL